MLDSIHVALGSYINIHLLLAAVLGALIGLERELAGKDPSLRTFALISVGSCVFCLVSREAALAVAHADPARIAAQVIPGIGFLGAGTIFRSTHGISGLTTAALMWVTAGIGMAVGFDRLDLAISTTVIALVITFMLRAVHKALHMIRGDKVDPAIKSPGGTNRIE